MMRRIMIVTVLAVALAAVAGPVAAQQATASPPLVKWGKWALLGGAVTMNLLAADAHDDANDVFAVIEDRCAVDETLCYAADDGSYFNAETEELYQQTLRYDRRARGWLVGGQGALLGAATLFIWEFTRPKSLPDNIPFEPEVEIGARETRLSLRVAF
jgi:hypothetical protein